ncbi:MAG: hypothetical protein AB1489_21300 [Acidobacteriota bacterium]
MVLTKFTKFLSPLLRYGYSYMAMVDRVVWLNGEENQEENEEENGVVKWNGMSGLSIESDGVVVRCTDELFC